MNPFTRYFGSGPIGVSATVGLFYLAHLGKERLGLPALCANSDACKWIFIISFIPALSLATWSVICLPPRARALVLCRSGPFRYIRHPLYAAFIDFLSIGIAFYMNNAIYLIWAIALHPAWHLAVIYEEKLMLGQFGEEYAKYLASTGRFIPRLRPGGLSDKT